MPDSPELQTLRNAIALHQAGQLPAAEQLYLSILQSQPENADVHHNLGILFLQTSQISKALAHFKHALVADPHQGKFWHSFIEALIQAGLYSDARQLLLQGKLQVGLQGAGIDELESRLSAPSAEEIRNLQDSINHEQWAIAVSLARELTTRFPDHGFGWKSLGMALHYQGLLPTALTALETARKCLPQDSQALGYLAATQMGLGNLTAALASYQSAIRLEPQNPGYYSGLACLQHKLGLYVEAESTLNTAVKLAPQQTELLINLGLNLQTQGRAAEAEYYFRQALALNPQMATVHHSLSIALKMQGRLPEAAISSEQALVLAPDYAEAHSNLGAIRFDQGLYTAAEACFTAAINCKPDYPEAYNNLGTVQQILRLWPKAEANFRQAIALNPQYADAHTNLGINLQSQGLIAEAETCWRTSLQINPQQLATQSGLVFHLNYTASSNYLVEAQKFGRMAAELATPYTRWNCGLQPQKLRIGLVSGDFRNHPVGHFLHSVLRHIDNARLELIAYATQPGTDQFSAKIHPYFAEWKNIGGISDAAAAELIHADGIHILLDIAGHSSHNRLSLFAWKPAPIQASWLGYLGSTGVGAIDYILSDPHAIYPDDEKNFTETVWRMPDSSICFTPAVPEITLVPLPAKTSGYITFGSFNNLTKMGDAVVALWSRILHRVENSRLILKAGQLNEAELRNKTLQRFAAHGIPAERLLLAGTVPNAAEHLAGYNNIDIALDTFPYPGVTTSIEALYMGVPVLTLRGNGILSRAGESISINAGLPEWLAENETDYVDKAVALAGNIEALAQLRLQLRARLVNSLLLDSVRFTRDFDEALWGMWQTGKVFT